MPPKKLTIYLSGPITGMPNNNYRAFAMLQEQIEALGHKVINPHELFEAVDTTGFEWEDYMRGCIIGMMQADLVITLSDWDKSKGARIEVDLARNLSMPVEHYVNFLHRNGIVEPVQA